MVNSSLIGTTRTHNGERTASSKNGDGKTGYLHAKKMKLEPYFTPLTKINLNWIKIFKHKP